jgi:hypothetical protein
VTDDGITRRTVKDPQFRTAEFDPDTLTKWTLEGTPSKLSVAWISRCENDTTARQAIESTAAILRDAGLITDEGHRAFLYRIGQRSQIGPYDFEDAGWLAEQMTRWLTDGPTIPHPDANELYDRMQRTVGVPDAYRLWRAAQAAAFTSTPERA